MIRSRIVITTAAIVAALSTSALAQDAAAGKKVFNKCKACHALDGKDKVGPHLDGIFGRTAGTAASFTKYSDAMKAKGAEGLVWDEETIAAYLAAPKDYVPGNTMAFPGLKKAEDVANLIAYLKAPE